MSDLRMPAAADDPLDELEALLLGTPWEDEGLLLSGVDGLIAGVLTTPGHIGDDEWPPLIWEGADAPYADDPPRQSRLVELALAHRATVVGDLLRGDYAPLIEIDGINGDELWEVWMEGFERATRLRPEAWRLARVAADHELADAVAAMLRLIDVANQAPMPRRERDTLTAEGAERIASIVPLLYARRTGLALG